MLRLFLATFWPTLISRLRRGPLRPSWPFLFEWTIRMLRRDWNEMALWPLQLQRAVVDARISPRPHVRKVTVRDDMIGGVPVRHFVPKNPGTTRIVYFHGGSYIYGSSKGSHADLCAHLALATSLEVIGVEYRLAPEHPWPAQLEDALHVCRELTGWPLILAGDSAGGHLAVKTAHQIRAKALVLLSPWVDLEMPARPSHVTNDPYDIGTLDVLARQARALAGEVSLSSLALAADPLDALPPTLVSIGDAEVLRDDMLAFVDALRAAGVHCTVDLAADMAHDPVLFEAYHPSAKAAFDRVVSFIRAQV